MRLSVRMRGHLRTTKRLESSRLGQLDERGAIQMSSSTNCASQMGAQASRTGLKLSQGCSVSFPIQTPHIVQCCISIQTTNEVGISTIETCQNCMVYYPAIHNISQILQEKTHTKAPKVMLQISWTTNGAGVFRCRDFELHPGFVSSTTKSSTAPMNLWWKATRSNINSKENAGTSLINQIECISWIVIVDDAVIFFVVM